jgi:hypothetical protein
MVARYEKSVKEQNSDPFYLPLTSSAPLVHFPGFLNGNKRLLQRKIPIKHGL